MYYRILGQSSLLFIWYTSCSTGKKQRVLDPNTLFHLTMRLIVTRVNSLPTHTPWRRGHGQLYLYYFIYDPFHNYHIKYK
jgi:hypothetical protein